LISVEFPNLNEWKEESDDESEGEESEHAQSDSSENEDEENKDEDGPKIYKNKNKGGKG